MLIFSEYLDVGSLKLRRRTLSRLREYFFRILLNFKKEFCWIPDRNFSKLKEKIYKTLGENSSEMPKGGNEYLPNSEKKFGSKDFLQSFVCQFSTKWRAFCRIQIRNFPKFKQDRINLKNCSSKI